MSINDFVVLKKLGEGSFGSVALVQKKSNNKKYALKKVRIMKLSSKEKENALNEVRILASINHPNIISYKDAFFDNESRTLNIILEFADAGDIEGMIKQAKANARRIPEEDIWNALFQMLSGLKYLHDNKIIHRDIKCANVFLTSDKIFKLGDLNVSKVVEKMAVTQTGTPFYASPEVWEGKPYNGKSDIWSLGCVVYEMCTLNPPFNGKDIVDLSKNVRKGKYRDISSSYSRELSEVIKHMLTVEASDRPDASDLLVMNYFNRFNYAEGEGNFNLIGTIKVPRNVKDMNKLMPKNKGYDDVLLLN